MKKILFKIIKKIINQKQVMFLIEKLIDLYNIDIATLYFKKKGILKYQDEYISGEYFVLDKVIPRILGDEKAIVFDVGANDGSYSLLVEKKLSFDLIYAFEPNPLSYDKLKLNLINKEQIRTFNIGFGNEKVQKEIFTISTLKHTQHATLHKSVLTDLHRVKDIESYNIEISTIDSFCKENQIKKIDFLKIDTEGHELFVLEGAKEMIDNLKIKIIQFEFNEMNTISRVFLKDFYKILLNYNIFRIDSEKLIYLKDYSTYDEIFLFQNLLAVHKSIDIKSYFL